MLTSMTGFGKAEGTIRDMSVTIELKSVNSRFLEIFVAVPKFLNFLEEPVRKYLRDRVQRGNVHCFINMGSSGTPLASYVPNMPLLKKFVATVRQISDETGIDPKITMQDLLAQPELLTLEENSIGHEVLEAEMLKVLERAVAGLLDMEKQEGEFIRAIFRERLASITRQLQSIRDMQNENIQRHIQTLRSRIAALLKEEPNELVIHQEIVQMADKLDISEELDRFDSHLSQFDTYLDSGESVGKRLNFILQEMNREVTTMGNKASHSGISQHVVEIKNELEILREQVQNIQ